MKAGIISGALCLFLVILIALNTVFLDRTLTDMLTRAEAIEPKAENQADFEQLKQDFMEHQKIISLTVSHEDLTEIELSFAEIIGGCECGDDDAITIAKSRLIMTLSHLRRLSGINIDSVL